MIALAVVATLSLPSGVSCESIRAAVHQYGYVRSLAWALEHGYSWGQIRAAKRCLDAPKAR